MAPAANARTSGRVKPISETIRGGIVAVKASITPLRLPSSIAFFLLLVVENIGSATASPSGISC